jgi:predicted HicB family RNase H-like nuclease
MSKGKIYIYSHPSLGNGIVKVGRTNSSAQKRATQHLRLNPKSNEMTVHFEREVENIKWTEKHLHQFLSPYRAKGAHWNSEHYQLSPKYARDLVSEFLKDPQNYILNHSKLNEESPALLTIRFSSDLRKAVRVAAAGEDKSMNQWIVDTLSEAVDKQNKKEYAMSPYIIIRKDNEVLERIPFNADNLSVAVSEVCEEVRKRGYECEEGDVEFLPAEREAQGPDTPERAIINV